MRPSRRGRWTQRRVTLLCAAGIGLAALAVYCNSFNGVFIFDDGPWISDNASIRHLWPIGSWLRPDDIGMLGGRPLLSLSLAINFAIGRWNPAGYHIVNLAIHILAAWTLFGLIRRTLLLPPPHDAAAQPVAGAEPNGNEFGEPSTPPLAAVATPLALAAALLWTVHPLQTGAVTYIIQRTESLVALFYLLTLYCVLRGASCQAAAAL